MTKNARDEALVRHRDLVDYVLNGFSLAPHAAAAKRDAPTIDHSRRSEAAVALVPEILVGIAAGPSLFPEVVAIKHGFDYDGSGVAIAARWVLTAGDCIASMPSNVLVGDKIQTGTPIPVSKIISLRNGVALLEVTADLPPPFPTLVNTCGTPASGSATIVGFGFNDRSQTVGRGEKRYGYVRLTGNDGTTVTSAAGLQDTCKGDSGGPCYALVNGNLLLIGITQEGSSQMCGSGSDYAFLGPAAVTSIRQYATTVNVCT